MKDTIIIRTAKIDDFDQIQPIISQVHKLHVEKRNDIFKEINSFSFEEFNKDIIDENNIYLVAELNSKVVGICFSTIKEISNNPTMQDRKILYIKDFCVDIHERHKGIGRMLYEEIKKRAKIIDVDSIELMVWEFNVDAINFYKNLGMNIKTLRFEQKIKL